jgi:PAS domain S-box-containing protein
MFENAAVGIGLMSLDRVVLECNDAVTQLFGYTPAEFINRPSAEMIHPEDRAVDADLYAELIAGKRRSYQVEKRYAHKDGHYVWAKLILSAVRGPDGQALYLLGMIVDIDEQKRIEQELSEQEANYRRLLEQRVYERTLELRKANEQLQSEMDQRLRVEEALAHKAAEEAVVAERNRLARDLHDAVTQTLFSASLLADVLPDLYRLQPAEGERRLEELRQLTRGALAEMRTLLVELRPSALTDIPLPDLLRQLGDATIGRARLPVQVTVDGDLDLPGDVQVALYRVAQEALNNAVKYARASSANINLRLSAASVRLSVIDNGIGFDPEAVPPNHFGLRIMRERAEAVGARLSVYSEPGQGTQITVSWTGKS